MSTRPFILFFVLVFVFVIFTPTPTRANDPLVAFGRAPVARSHPLLHPATNSLESILPTPAYAVDLVNQDLVAFTLTSPGNLNIIDTSVQDAFAGDFQGNDFAKLYAIHDVSNLLVSINTSTGAETAIGTVNAPNQGVWTGMAYDPTTGKMFGSLVTPDEGGGYTCNSGASSLYEINLTNAQINFIGAISYPVCLIDVAISSAGVLYGVDLINDDLIRINKTTGIATAVGDLGFDANFAQDMDFDYSSETLYLAAYNNGLGRGELRRVNLATGSSSLIGPFEGGTELDAFGINASIQLGNADSGFRPNPDGYNFLNWGTVYPLPPDTFYFTMLDMEEMFGQDAVCETAVGSLCIAYKQSAKEWLIDKHRQMLGHCFGMTITSLRFFREIDDPSHFQPFADSTYDLFGFSAKPNITYYMVTQWAEPVASALILKTPNEVLNELYVNFTTPNSDPLNLIFAKEDLTGGHSVTPYQIVAQGNNIYHLKVYDNNFPNDTNRYFIFNTNTNTWSYHDSDYSGGNGINNIGVTPISLSAGQLECPFCENEARVAQGFAQYSELNASGGARLLVTDSAGRRVGYLNGQLINEIADAAIRPPLLGFNSNALPSFSLPDTSQYTIAVQGDTLTQTTPITLTQFGPGYGITVGRVPLVPNSTHQLQISTDGRTLTYESPTDVQALLRIANDMSDQSIAFELHSIELDAGQPISLRNQEATGDVAIVNSEGNVTSYSFTFTRSNGEGEYMFDSSEVALEATATHYIEYDAWDNSAPTMLISIDEGSDGTIDETIEVEVAPKQMFIPIVQRH